MLKPQSKIVTFIALLLALCLPVLAGGRATLLIAQAQTTTVARSSAFYEEHERCDEKDEIREASRRQRLRRLHLTFDTHILFAAREIAAAEEQPPLSWRRARPVPLRPVEYLLAPLPLRAPPARA